jgi:hypothetical protein
MPTFHAHQFPDTRLLQDGEMMSISLLPEFIVSSHIV